MKKFKNNLLSGLFLLVTTVMFSQGKIKGTIVDNDLNGALPGVNVVIKGTTQGTSTDVDGKFVLKSTAAAGQVVVSYIGYQSKTVNFTTKNGELVDLGVIKLTADSNELTEVVVKSTIIDVAKDRKTPVAVSTIKASEIQQKLGNQEFPEILANTPSVYATKAGGGFGDSRINIRGFDQKNIAVMINGVPVNDMENSAVFWSNWAGLSDVTSAMQVQRGLGSSKLAISSVGGTINVVTKTSDMKEGGVVGASVANNNYLKTQASYNTGVMKNGLSASVLLSRTAGSTYANGTQFEGANYFLAFGYKPNEKHDFQFTFTGAPQWHNQRSAAPTIADYIKYGNGVDPNTRYNSDWGRLDNNEYSFRTNYYHKPVASFNWDFKINESTKLSTVVYGSWGRGAGSNGIGGIKGKSYFDGSLKTADGLVNVDLINDWNSGLLTTLGTRTTTGGVYQNSSASGSATDFKSGISKISSVNSHNWYGGVIDLNKKFSKNLSLDFGIDVRTYKGIHYQNINDLLGATNYAANYSASGATNNDINNPIRTLAFQYETKPNLNPFVSTDYQQKISYNNEGLVKWYGAFTQLEYTSEQLTAFVQAAVSQQGFQRVDYFKYLSSDPLSKSENKKILGGDVKAGVNYNINKNHNFFANAGFYSKQPFFNAVFAGNINVVNKDITNEKIKGLELGYGFRSSKFNANVNVYRTTWDDRFLNSSTSAIDADGLLSTPTVRGYAFLSGVSQIHKGAELDFTFKPFSKLSFNGMFSYGDWSYGNSTVKSQYFREDTNAPLLVPVSLTQTDPNLQYKTEQNISGLKVGDAAQMTASLGATLEVVERLKVDANYRYADNLYASLDPSKFTTQAIVSKGTLKLPSYGLMDAGLSYKMLVGKDKANTVNFRINVNNVLDKVYIAESRTNIFADDYVTGTSGPTYESAGKTYNGVATANQVFFGFGRTWNFGINYNF
jgi:outer membrane cobalamin receptor